MRAGLLAMLCAAQACTFPDYRVTNEGAGGSGARAGDASGEAGAGPGAAGGTLGGSGAGAESGAGAQGGSGGEPAPCNPNMRVCATMDDHPVQEGWTASTDGGANLNLKLDKLTGDSFMEFRSPGAEGGDHPYATLSIQLPNVGDYARFTFELRVAEFGPYTNVALAKLDFGERELGLYMRTNPTMREISLRYARSDPHDVVWELQLGPVSAFEQTRRFELECWLGGAPRVSLTIDDESVLEEPLDTGWSRLDPELSVGLEHEDLPTSGAAVEFDDVGFDDRPR